MNWLAIIIGIIQLILGRILPAPNRSQAFSSIEPQLCNELAHKIAAINSSTRSLSTQEIEALAGAMPGFIDDIISWLPKDFWDRAGSCAASALLNWIKTRDLPGAISGFVTCTLSGVGGGGGGTNPPGGGGGGMPPGGGNGGIDPNQPPAFRDVGQLC